MPYLHQYDYIFAIGTLAAALDACEWSRSCCVNPADIADNIGANDVAK